MNSNTPANTLPSPRTPVVTVDANGIMTFSRSWYLFLQALWAKTGGAIDDPTEEAQLLGDLDTDVSTVDAAHLTRMLLDWQVSMLDADLRDVSHGGLLAAQASALVSLRL